MRIVTCLIFLLAGAVAFGEDCDGIEIPPRTAPIYHTFEIGRDKCGGKLTISGEILQHAEGNNSKAALLTVRFLDASTNCCGVGGLSRTGAIPTKPGYVYLPSRKGIMRFEKEVSIPTNAITAEIGCCVWKCSSAIRICGMNYVMCAPLENTLVVRVISQCVQHYVTTGIVLACSLCLLMVLFYRRYYSGGNVDSWINTAIIINYILASFALSFAVTDMVMGLLIVLTFCMIAAWSRRMVLVSARDVYVAVFSIGIVLRFMAVFSIEMTPFSDFQNYWSQIVRWSELQFVDTKSYPTVAFYSPLIALFGAHYVVVGITNTFVGVVQMWLAKEVARRMFRNEGSGIMACALIGLNPILIIMIPAVSSEVLYGTMILFTSWSILRLYDEIPSFCTKRVVRLSVLVGFLSMITMYTRGTGAGLIFSGCSTIVLLALRERRLGASIRYVFIPFFVVCTVMLCAMCGITSKTIGYVCPTGSNQQKWVYLYGSNIERKGNGYGYDNELINNLYAKIYPGQRFSPQKADPIIMGQFKKRWVDNTAGEVALSLKKHYWLSRSDGKWAYWMNTHRQPEGWIGYVLDRGISILRSALVLVFIIGSVGLLCKCRFDCAERSLVVIIFYLFNVAMTFITVWTSRYNYTLWIVLPIMASAFMILFEGKKIKLAKAEG